MKQWSPVRTYKVEADAFTSAAGYNVWSIKGENKRVPPGSESTASMRLLVTAYLGDLAYSRKGIFRARSISSKAEETACKESDSPVVPTKPVMTAEERGGRVNRS